MPKLIIVNGKPASGKTTLVKYLQKKLELPMLGKDDLKEFLFDTLGTGDREWSRVIGRASVDMLYVYAETMLAEGKDILVENAFWADFAADVLSQVCDRTNSTALEFYCFTDIDTRTKRNTTRLENGDRHEGHVDGLLKIDDAIDEERYRPLAIGKTIRIDTTHLDTDGYDAIVREITEFVNMKETAA